MSKGNPNDNTQLNFTAKVWDTTAKAWKPIYIAPDATSAIRGDVYLSDAVNSTDNAATGVTAATPAAVKNAYDSAVKNNITTEQSMQSNLTPNTNNTLSLGTSAKKWANMYATTFHGALDGNATTATSAKQLDHNVTFSVQNGSAAAGTVTTNLSGTTANISLSQLDASTLATGTVPLDRLPQGALERLVHVADQTARFKLTTATVQLGDIVQQDDTGVMYVVTDESKLTSAAGYTEFTAGTATKANEAAKLNPGSTIRTNLASTSAVTFTGASAVTPGVTGTLPVGNGGTGAATLAQYGVLVGAGTGAIQSVGNAATGAVYKSSASANPTVGTLPIAQGGTGSTSADGAWSAIGGGDIGKLNKGTSTTTYLRNDGTWATPPDNNTWTAFKGATSSAAGAVGYVSPAPSAGDQNKFFRADGSWQVPTNTDTNVTQNHSTANGAYPILLKNGTGTGNITSTSIFDGDVTVNPSNGQITALQFNGALNGNASTATKATSADSATSATTATSAGKWTTSRTISLTGNVTGSTSGVDGSGNISISTTLADNTVNAAKVVDGSITAADLINGIGLVYVGATDPGINSKYNIWIQP